MTDNQDVKAGYSTDEKAMKRKDRIPSQHAQDELNLRRQAVSNYSDFQLVYRGVSGLGHRTTRMSSAYHLAKALGLPSLIASWGWECGLNENGDPDIFDHLFGAGAMLVPPAKASIYPWSKTSQFSATKGNDTRKRDLRLINDVPGYECAYAVRNMDKYVENNFYSKPESDVEFYRQLRTMFRFNDEARNFTLLHNFSAHTMIGLHIRAGNGEKGDFTKRRRGVDDIDTWISNMGALLQDAAKLYVHDAVANPPKLFVATDTPSAIPKLRNATRDWGIDIVVFEQARVQEGAGVSYYNKWDGEGDACRRGWVNQFMDMTLLSACDMVVAGQFSSFTQTMPLSTMLASSVSERASGLKTDRNRQKRLFCEVSTRSGDTMECYNNYTEWFLQTDRVGSSSSPIGKGDSSTRYEHQRLINVPRHYPTGQLKSTFAGTVLEDAFA